VNKAKRLQHVSAYSTKNICEENCLLISYMARLAYFFANYAKASFSVEHLRFGVICALLSLMITNPCILETEELEGVHFYSDSLK